MLDNRNFPALRADSHGRTRGEARTDLVLASGKISHRMWQGQAGGWTRVWQRHGLTCGGVRQTCGNQFLIPLVLLFAPHHHFPAPLWCACAPWLRDRAPCQVAMAVAMAHHCHSLCLGGAGRGWARVWWGLAKWKAHVWRHVVCRTLGPSLGQNPPNHHQSAPHPRPF